MQRINISKGLDLPITGSPTREISEASAVTTVALLGRDYVGMKPTMAVQVGDKVKEGQLLFTDKKTPGVRHTSPGCGEVVAINRGAKRALQSVVVRLEGDDAETFERWDAAQLANADAGKIGATLLASGLWTALRTRPFSRVPAPETTPRSIFVTAIDTNPLAVAPGPIIAERADDFIAGLTALTRLADKNVFLCTAPGDTLPGSDVSGVTMVAFGGPHPAGLPGTHIHFLDPVGRKNTVWYINYQDVIAVGALLTTGRLDFRRVIALGGPLVERPRLLRTRLGAATDVLADVPGAQPTDGEHASRSGIAVEGRVISGSVLCGRRADGPTAFLGRYHLQLAVLAEGRHRELFGWTLPGFGKYSIENVFAACFGGKHDYPLTTAMNGGLRAIVPIGSYEKVMPLDILPTFLFQALEVDDVERAEALGCLELDEEDVALCTFACPGKGDFGAMLRRNLTTIEKEG